MRDEVEPLAVPAQQARPDLEARVRLDLAAEVAGDAAEGDGEGALLDVLGAGRALGVGFGARQAPDALAQEGGDEVRARDVEVGEVGRVRLVQVVVAFGERGTGGRDERLEEGVRGERRRLEVELVDEAAEEADLEGE